MNRNTFIKSKSIEAAQRLARYYGVEHPVYVDFTLEQANTVNQALTKVPEKARPDIICSIETLYSLAPDSAVFHRDGLKIKERTLKEVERDTCGVYPPLDYTTPTCGKKAIALNLRKISQRNNLSFVIYHELAHAFADRVLGGGVGVVVPLKFHELARRWCRESGIERHREYLEKGQFSEIWADAWSLYHSGFKLLPGYIVRHIEQYTI